MYQNLSQEERDPRSNVGRGQGSMDMQTQSHSSRPRDAAMWLAISFDEFHLFENERLVKHSKCRCRECIMIISGTGNRKRRFHVIVYFDHPLPVRHY